MNTSVNTLTSFSGADLVVTFANQAIAELQQISWAVQREKAPVFTLGSPDARSFSRGKRGIAGSLVMAVFDHDALIEAMKRVWNQIAPPAMFTAAGNISLGQSENFMNILDTIKWNKKVTADVLAAYGENSGYGFSGTSAIGISGEIAGSNSIPQSQDGYFVDGWLDSKDKVYIPAGFEPIRGENIIYADTLPPFDCTLTFANEYGQTAFQKIYDIDILNESSGVSVDTVVMERQLTYIARRISPLIKGVYTREEGGRLRGVPPYQTTTT